MILVFGENGQVAKELSRQDGVVCVGRRSFDLTDPKFVGDFIASLKPKAVINAAAYTSVDMAEANEGDATVLNGEAPIQMALACKKQKIPMLQISTDFVFSGKGQNAWQPSDTPAPLNAYGRSKYFGEQGIINTGAFFIILRTSWVFSAIGQNFVKKIIDLSQSREEIFVVKDEIGGPTSAFSIARACISIIQKMQKNECSAGIYHFSGKEDVSRFSFAEFIIERINSKTIILPASETAYPSQPKRPKNSRLNCSSIYRDFGIKRPCWRNDIDRILIELKHQNNKPP